MFTEKRYRVKFNSIKKYFVTHKAKTKKFKNTKTYLNETMFENQERRIFRTPVNYLIPGLS